MAKYFKKNMHFALANGLSAGEFTIAFDEKGNEVLSVCIARADRKGDLINFTSPVFEKEVIEDNYLLEDGFYPIKVRGKTRLTFVYAGVAHIVPSGYANAIRLSGGLIDLDKEVFMRDMKKAADHLAAENRKLMKEVKDLRKSFEEEREERKLLKKVETAEPNEYARQKRREEAQINYALRKVSDEDDDDLY